MNFNCNHILNFTEEPLYNYTDITDAIAIATNLILLLAMFQHVHIYCKVVKLLNM